MLSLPLFTHGIIQEDRGHMAAMVYNWPHKDVSSFKFIFDMIAVDSLYIIHSPTHSLIFYGYVACLDLP